MVSVEIGGEQGTTAEHETDTDGWDEVTGYGRKVLVLLDDGTATFDYARPYDIFKDSELNTSIVDFTVSNSPSDPGTQRAIGTQGSPILIGPKGIGGFTLSENNLSYFHVKYGPFNAPSSTAGVTLSITPAALRFVGGTQAYTFQTGVTLFDNVNDPIPLGGDSLALEYPDYSNDRGSVKVEVDTPNGPETKPSATISVQYGNEVFVGATTYKVTNTDDAENLLLLASNFVAAGGNASDIFGGHSGGFTYTIDAGVYSDLYIDSQRTIGLTTEQLPDGGQQVTSYIYIIFPQSWGTLNDDITDIKSPPNISGYADLKFTPFGANGGIGFTNELGYNEDYVVYISNTGNPIAADATGTGGIFRWGITRS